MQSVVITVIILAIFTMIAVGVLLEATTLTRALLKNVLVVGGVILVMLVAGALA